MKEMTYEQMESIEGGKDALGVFNCVMGIIGGSLGFWGMAAVMASVAAGGPMTALGTATVILGPTLIGGAIVSCIA